MDRRIALTALAGAALAGPALAQTSTSGSGTSASGMSSSGGSSSGSAAGGMHAMGPAEMTHLQKTMTGGMFLMETAKAGTEKARNADVKRFATFELDEQTGLSEVLRSMMDPSMGGAAMGGAATGGASATSSSASSAGGSSASMATPAPSGAPAAAGSMPAGMAGMPMDTDKMAMMQRLRAAEAGAAFDLMFLEAQLMGHQEALRVQEDYLQQGRNREHVSVAKLARSRIKEHIEEIGVIQKEMKG